MENKPEAKRTLVALFFVTLVDMTGFGIMIPCLPFFAKTFGASTLVISILISTFALMGLVTASFLGWLSDHWGRKRLLAIGVIATIIANIMIAEADALWIIFVARVIAGASAGKLAISDAFVADVTSIANRAKAIGMVQSGMAVGFVLGPAMGGWLVGDATDQDALRLPFLVAAAAQFLALLLVIFLLKEPKVEKLTEDRAKYREAFSFTFQNPPILLAMIMISLGNIIVAANLAVFPVWSFDLFAWNARDVGLIFAVVGVFIVVAQAGLVGPMHRKLSQGTTALIAFALMFVGQTIILFHGYGNWTIWFGSLIFALGYGLTNPTMSAICSTRTPPAQQGAILGLSDSVRMGGSAFGPILIGATYDSIHHDAPIVSFALLAAIGIFLAFLVRRYDVRKSAMD